MTIHCVLCLNTRTGPAAMTPAVEDVNGYQMCKEHADSWRGYPLTFEKLFGFLRGKTGGPV